MLHKDTLQCFKPCDNSSANKALPHCKCVNDKNDCLYCMPGDTTNKKCDICPKTAEFSPHWDIKSCQRTDDSLEENTMLALSCGQPLTPSTPSGDPRNDLKRTNRQPIEHEWTCKHVAKRLGITYLENSLIPQTILRITTGCYFYVPKKTGAKFGHRFMSYKHTPSPSPANKDDYNTMHACYNPYEMEAQTFAEYSH